MTIDGQPGYIFDPDEADSIDFIPSQFEIKKSEEKIKAYLINQTKNNNTIYERIFDELEPLQDRLIYYKRRYFGQINAQSQKIIRIEFVFVRCGGRLEWKNIDYPNSENRECWWNAIYNIDEDKIEEFNYQYDFR